METKQLKIYAFKKVGTIPTIDTFKTLTFDNVRVYLEIKENKNTKIAYISTNFQVIGYTEDMIYAFNLLHNISLYTLDEIFNSRGNLKNA